MRNRRLSIAAVCGAAVVVAACLCALNGGALAWTAQAARNSASGHQDLVTGASLEAAGAEADTTGRGMDDRCSSKGDRAVEADDDDDCDCADESVWHGSDHKAERSELAMCDALSRHATVTEPVEYETVRRLLAGPSLEVRPPPVSRCRGGDV